MIDRYPHRITFKTRPAAPVFDSNGDISAAAETWSAQVQCRFVSNEATPISAKSDGPVKDYTHTVYMPYSAPGTNYDGCLVRLYDAGGNLACECLVQHTRALQLSTVLYAKRCR